MYIVLNILVKWCRVIAKNTNSIGRFSDETKPEISHRNWSLAFFEWSTVWDFPLDWIGLINLWLDWIKKPRRKWLSLGVLRERHPNSTKIQSIGLTYQRAKTSKQKTSKESSKDLRYLWKWFFNCKTESIFALATKRS